MADGNPHASLREIVDSAGEDIFGPGRQLAVKQFGSRAYGAAGPRRDWDFFVALPADDARKAKLLRASIRKFLIDSNITKWNSCEDQPEKNTLAWTTTTKQKVSINVSVEGAMKSQQQATAFLAAYFNQYPKLKKGGT